MNDGGPAFPVHEHGGSCLDANGCTHCQFPSHHGMSLRAYFAGLAMESLIMHNHKQRFEGAPSIQYSATAYEAVWYADAMIAALEVKYE